VLNARESRFHLSQTDLLIQAANGWLSDFLAVEDGLGIRRGEALTLRCSDIVGDFAHIGRSLCQVKDQLTFKGTKSDRPRGITIPGVTMEALRRQQAEHGKNRAMFPDYRFDLDLVFATSSGEPLRPDSVSAKVALLCRKLKLPKGASLHTLRHSHGSQLIAGGETVANVSQRLGHSNPATTLGIYTHVIETDDGDTARLWEKLQGKKGEKHN
jgi:integrase